MTLSIIVRYLIVLGLVCSPYAQSFNQRATRHANHPKAAQKSAAKRIRYFTKIDTSRTSEKMLEYEDDGDNDEEFLSDVGSRKTKAPTLTTTTLMTTTTPETTSLWMNLTNEEIIANILNSKSKDLPEALGLTLVYCLLLIAGERDLVSCRN